ncbi:Transferrin [Eumeta japonica]|uniref:Transferrin n=1 Tax=Eumeta variegata TaxID=151549 RepID=A0A4C1Z3W7_EUMVA|nr:Transferrin [Eumeta japonica]
MGRSGSASTVPAPPYPPVFLASETLTYALESRSSSGTLIVTPTNRILYKNRVDPAAAFVIYSTRLKMRKVLQIRRQASVYDLCRECPSSLGLLLVNPKCPRFIMSRSTPCLICTSVKLGRNLADIDATRFYMPTQRWCTISEAEQHKCEWVRHALHTLGVEPALSCQRGRSPLHCLWDIRAYNADFIAIDSNYGYSARHNYGLSSILIVKNYYTSKYRIAALVRSTSNVTSFENLRGKKACFPEFGGIAFLSFVATGHNKSILSTSECNYAKVVAEFFNGTCAPGALDSMHRLYDSIFNINSLCNVCKSQYPAVGNRPSLTCKTDSANLYYGNDGALTCLADQSADVAFVEVQDLNEYLHRLNLPANTFRPLCRGNNSLGSPGAFITDDCLMSRVINSEVLGRKYDLHLVSLTSLLKRLDHYFGSRVPAVRRLIDLQVYSLFNGTSNLLFKDSVTGLFSPSHSRLTLVKDYFELFEHLDSCKGSAKDLAVNGLFCLLAMMVVSVLTI